MATRGLLIALLLLGLTGAAAASEQRIALPAGEAMVISWNPAWVVAAPEINDPQGTVRFDGGKRELWAVTLTPLPPHPSLTGDTGNLRIYVRAMTRALENGGVTVDSEQLPINGSQAHGFYVKASDLKASSRKKTELAKAEKAPDYSHGYIGALSISGRPYLFEVAWNSGGDAAAAAALTSVRSLRIQVAR